MPEFDLINDFLGSGTAKQEKREGNGSKQSWGRFPFSSRESDFPSEVIPAAFPGMFTWKRLPALDVLLEQDHPFSTRDAGMRLWEALME